MANGADSRFLISKIRDQALELSKYETETLKFESESFRAFCNTFPNDVKGWLPKEIETSRGLAGGRN